MPKYLVTIASTYTILADDMAEAVAVAEESADMGLAPDSVNTQADLIGPDPFETDEPLFNPFVDIAEMLNGRKGEEGA